MKKNRLSKISKALLREGYAREDISYKPTNDKGVVIAPDTLLTPKLDANVGGVEYSTLDVQRALNSVGYDLEEDGVSGSLTKDAILSYGADDLKELLHQYGMEPDDKLYGSAPQHNGVNHEVPLWIVKANELLGTHEIRGLVDNPIITEMHRCSLGAGYHDETPWCASAQCLVWKRSGYSVPRNSARALSWKRFGVGIIEPVYGAVCVKTRYNSEGRLVGGHVGWVVGCNRAGDIIYVMGGNQSDEFNVRAYRRSSWSYFRIPVEYEPYADLRTAWEDHKLTYKPYMGRAGRES